MAEASAVGGAARALSVIAPAMVLAPDARTSNLALRLRPDQVRSTVGAVRRREGDGSRVRTSQSPGDGVAEVGHAGGVQDADQFQLGDAGLEAVEQAFAGAEDHRRHL